ncbi:MAG: hypothetical protein SF051_09960 [Elusimicrobiota bacterium]|nr:hypothetical protein [Elusimicrobiota bacterium]
MDERDDEDRDCRPVYRWTADSRLLKTTRCGAADATRDEKGELRP